MFYIMTILISALIIVIGNLLFLPFSWEMLSSLSLSVAIGVIAIIAVDGIFALIIRRLTPRSWYHPDMRIFKVSKRERDFYFHMKIKKWKDLVPELGLFTGFSKSEVKDAQDSAYLERFLIESNYGVIIHLANALLGFLIVFIPCCSSPSVWIPIYIVNFVLSLAPVAVLRFSTHTLFKLYKRSKK